MPVYIDEINRALISFQFIEELLRIYLDYAYQLIQLRVGDVLPVRLARKDVERFPLGHLIREFAKFNDTKGLVEGMGRLARLRNELVHRGLLLTFEEQQDQQAMDERATRAQRIATAADGCVQELIAEVGRVAERLKQLRPTANATESPLAPETAASPHENRQA